MLYNETYVDGASMNDIVWYIDIISRDWYIKHIFSHILDCRFACNGVKPYETNLAKTDISTNRKFPSLIPLLILCANTVVISHPFSSAESKTSSCHLLKPVLTLPIDKKTSPTKAVVLFVPLCPVVNCARKNLPVR